MKTNKLNGCPFCGNCGLLSVTPVKLSYQVQVFQQISCAACGGTGPYGETLDEAIDLWQVRASGGTKNENGDE